MCVRMNGGKATRRAEQWPWFLWRGCARASMCCSMPPSFGAPPPHLVPPHHHHHPLGYKTSVRSLATACLGLRQGHGNISLSLHFFFFFFFSLVLYCKREEKHPPRPTLPPVITFFPVKKEKRKKQTLIGNLKRKETKLSARKQKSSPVCVCRSFCFREPKEPRTTKCLVASCRRNISRTGRE